MAGKKGNGAQKGSTFERDICKQLSLWWTEDERDDIFWRTAGSGGRATQRAKRGTSTAGAYGDLTFTDPLGAPLFALCCFELKRGYGQWCLMDLVDRKTTAKPCAAALFWRQAKESADQAQVPYPVVIFKRDQKQTMIMLPKALLSAASAFLGPNRSIKIGVRIDNTDVIVMTLPDFLNYFTPQAIQELV